MEHVVLIHLFTADILGRMHPPGAMSHLSHFNPNKPLSSGGVSEVIASKNPDFKVGDIITGMTEWENYTVVKGPHVAVLEFKKLPDEKSSGIPYSYNVG